MGVLLYAVIYTYMGSYRGVGNMDFPSQSSVLPLPPYKVESPPKIILQIRLVKGYRNDPSFHLNVTGQRGPTES